MQTCVVLMYHFVDKPKSEREARLCCPPTRFAAQMEYLRSHGYNVIPLSELVRSLNDSQTLPSKAVAVTFDDGASCIYEHGLPVLAQYSIPATVFMLSGLVGRSNEWLLRVDFPERRMLSAGELKTLDSAGVTIGSHTVSHPWLSRLTSDQVREEIRTSKTQLQDVLGHQVSYFAYPYGDYSEAIRDCVIDAGYSAACSTRWGKQHTADDLFALRRVEVTGTDSLFAFALKLHLATHNIPPVPEARHWLRGAFERLGLMEARRSSRN